MKFDDIYNSIIPPQNITEDNVAGAGGVFGQEVGHGGKPSSDWYNEGDARIATPGVTVTRTKALSAAM